MARPEKIRLGDLLVREKLITQDQLEFALEQQKTNGHKLGRVLVENGFVTEEHISESLAMQFSIPYINLKNYNINLDLVRLLPESQARRFRAIVLEEQDGKLLVGMSDPTDSVAQEEVARLVKRAVAVAVVTEGQLLQSIDRGYLRTEEIAGMGRMAGKSAGDNANANFASLVDRFGTEDAPAAGLLKRLFDDAMRLHASDVHIEPQDGSLRVRFRIDGVLHRHT
ncbi:MAG: MSHA biogenesis protein MshE, partial [Gallionella sp.]|nr:MSHA biogenesis protein MshE [Gallionella sp.]